MVGDEEQRVIELDCTAAEVCVVDGAKRNCFPAEFTMNQFAYEIPVDKKRNTCALP